MERGLEPLGWLLNRVQYTVRKKAGTEQRDFCPEPGGGIIPDELRCATTGKKHKHRVGFDGGDLSEQRLKLDVREGYPQTSNRFAAGLDKPFGEPCDGLFAGAVF